MQTVTSKRLPELQRSQKNTKEYKNAWNDTGKFDHGVQPPPTFKTLYETCITP